MGTLFLVRHGQASFGSDDYDRLSELGHRQCRALGAHWRDRGQTFDAVFTGTLRRHRESLAAMAEGLGGLPQAQQLKGLNEYDPAALLRAIHPAPLPAPASPEAVRQYFRLLRDGLLSWMKGETAPEGMPTYPQFRAGVADALAQALAHAKEQVLIVSSAGPIAVAVGLVLDLAPPAVVDLNLRIRNSALTEFHAHSQRHVLHTFNTLPHLDAPDRADWISFS